jgi:hypothetical protein
LISAGVVVISPSGDDDDAVFGNVETVDHPKDFFEAELHGPRAAQNSGASW